MAETPWDMAKKRQAYQRQETSLSEGGKKQINSGRFWFSKRDVRNWGFLLEARTTTSKSFSIKAEELIKLIQDALFHNSLPGMPIEFEEYNQKWILIRQTDFEAMQQELVLLIEELRSMRAGDK